jgi:hypothetical protein
VKPLEALGEEAGHLVVRSAHCLEAGFAGTADIYLPLTVVHNDGCLITSPALKLF